MVELVPGNGVRPADDFVRDEQKRETPPALKVGPGSAAPTPAPQPVAKSPPPQAVKNEADKAFDVALNAAQRAQKEFNIANGSYNVAAAKYVHTDVSDPGRDKALTDVALKVVALKDAAEAQFEACKWARDAALKTGDQKKIQSAQEAYGKAEIQLNTEERVRRIVDNETHKLANAVLTRMGLAGPSQEGSQQVQRHPSPPLTLDDARKATESASKYAKETENHLMDAFDELGKAQNELDNVKGRPHKLKDVDDAKRQVRESAEALVKVAENNVKAWEQADKATKAEANLAPNALAYELAIKLVEGHVTMSLQLKTAAESRSNQARVSIGE